MKKYLFTLLLVIISIQSVVHRVAIIGTNDIHGSAFPTQMFRDDTNETYYYGGLEFMAQMMETIKEQYNCQVLYLDGGDQFQGGIESSSYVSSGQIMNDFYNTIGVSGAAVGNHQFDFGPEFLNNYWAGRDRKSVNLGANIRSEKGEQNFLPLHKGEKLFTLKSGIKIGVIGLSTIDTPSTTSGFSSGAFPQFKFLPYVEIVQDRSKILRKAGAHAVFIVSHVGNFCQTDNTFGIWYEDTPQKSTCRENDEIGMLINSLPQGTIDGVVQGHRHVFSHHYIRSIPIMGTNNGGFYFNVMHLTFEDFKINKKKTHIEGPIPVCEKIFENTRTCEYLDPDALLTAGKLIPFNFHGVTVHKHPGVQYIFNKKWAEKMVIFRQKLVLNKVLMQRNFTHENDLGNLITNLLNEAVPGNDVVILNTGGFRTIWYPGVLQFQHFFNMFPFDNTVISFEMTGKQLLDTLKIIQSGTRAFYATYGLTQKVTREGPTSSFISASFYNGTAIEPDKNYRVLSLLFLMQGGDDFRNVIGKVYTLRNQKEHGQFRSLVKPHLKKLGQIRRNTLVNPEKPRLDITHL